MARSFICVFKIVAYYSKDDVILTVDTNCHFTHIFHDVFSAANHHHARTCTHARTHAHRGCDCLNKYIKAGCTNRSNAKRMPEGYADV